MNENKRFEFQIIWYDWDTSCGIINRPKKTIVVSTPFTENNYLKDAILGMPYEPEITECNISGKAIRKLNGIHS